MNTMQIIYYSLAILLMIILLVNAIYLVKSNIKRDKEFKKWDRELKDKLLRERYELEVKANSYETALRKIRSTLNTNQNGSLDNLTKSIKSMMPKDLI